MPPKSTRPQRETYSLSSVRALMQTGKGGVMQDTEALEIPLELIESDIYQPRKTEVMALDMELMESIKQYGVLQPIVVRKLNDDHYMIVAGERRWRACKAAGRSTIPARVVDVDENGARILSLVENLLRAEMDEEDERDYFILLRDKFGLSQREIANLINKSRGYVERRLEVKNAVDIALEGEVYHMQELPKDVQPIAQRATSLDKSQSGFLKATSLDKSQSVLGYPIVVNAETKGQAIRLHSTTVGKLREKLSDYLKVVYEVDEADSLALRNNLKELIKIATELDQRLDKALGL